jgi:cytoskeletal protein CcmA (bactofilin family)
MGILGRNRRTDDDMAKETSAAQAGRENVISIIGPGMTVTGDCETDGTLRVEGVVQGTIRAGKAVVVGKDGAVRGDVFTQDAIIGGKVEGVIIAESRLELQATCVIDGEIRARRIKLDEGGRVNGQILTGDVTAPAKGERPAPAGQRITAGPVETREAAFHVQQG